MLLLYSGTWRSTCFPFGGSLPPPPSSVCKAGDVPSSSSCSTSSTSGVLGGHPLYFLNAKFCCIPASLLCTWVLQHCHAALIVGHSGHQEALHQITQSYWWLMVPANVPSYVQACYACTWAKKQMQRLQGLSHSPHPCLITVANYLNAFYFILFMSLTQRHTNDLGIEPVYSRLFLCHQRSCLQPCRMFHLGCFGSPKDLW